jgi:hypothetical protein
MLDPKIACRNKHCISNKTGWPFQVTLQLTYRPSIQIVAMDFAKGVLQPIRIASGLGLNPDRFTINTLQRIEGGHMPELNC